MLKKIKEAGEKFSREVKKVNDSKDLELIRLKYLSRKGIFSHLFEEFKQLSKEEKPKYGQLLNETKNEAQNKFDALKDKLDKSAQELKEHIDLTLPGRGCEIGSKHIITQTLEEIQTIFKGLGFSIYTGPELESDYNNFEALNFPADHPARDMQDTFFINKDFLLRTHTSPVQIRLMKEKKPPLRAIMPGKVYRNEALSAKS